MGRLAHDAARGIPGPRRGQRARAALVHALAAHWGAEAVDSGKCVWAQIIPGQEPPPDATADQLLLLWAGSPEDAGSAPPPAAASPAVPVSVVVKDLPVSELTTAKTHSEDLLRELQLLLLRRTTPPDPQATGAEQLPRPTPAEVVALAARLDAAARDLDSMRLQIRSQALRAAEHGHEQVTLHLWLPPGLSTTVIDYRAALDEAQRLTDDSELSAHAHALRRFSDIRRRYLDEIIDQLTDHQ